MSLTTTRQIMKFARIAALGVVVLAGLVTILGSGGGGGAGVGAPPANPAPQVTSMTPASNADNIAVDTTVTATFNEAMNAGTIDTSSFTLRNAQGALIPAAVTYNTNTRTATLTPNQPLTLLTLHTAELSTAITDQEGARLSNPGVRWEFLTVDRQWGNPVPVSMNTTGMTFNPKIAVNAKGDALAVWSQTDAMMGAISIYANSYTVGLGWGFPVLLEQQLGNANSPHVAINEDGIGFAVWQQLDGTQFKVYANRYVPGAGFIGGWDMMATVIGADSSDGMYPALGAQVAVDSAGNAVAAWEEAGPGPGAPGPDTVTSIWARIYTAGAGWAAMKERLETDDTGNASGVRIASSTDAGVVSQAVVVWEQTTDDLVQFGSSLNIWSNRFTQGVGWQTTAAQVDITTNGARRPELAMNAEGDALVVWEQNLLGIQEIWANSFEPGATGSGWETPKMIAGFPSVDQENPQVAISVTGDGLALHHAGTTLSSVSYRNDFWDPPMSVSGNARNAKIAIDANSNGLAVWERDTGVRSSIIANRWFGDNLPISGATDILSWGTEQVIDGGLGSFSPQIGVDGQGRALSIWEQGGSIWGNRWE
jgi:hypothetical protein